MKLLLDTARTYAFLYEVTGQRHYLDQAWSCLAKIKFMQEKTIELKLVG